MENPLRKHCKINVTIIYPQARPSRTGLMSGSYEHLAWVIQETLDTNDNRQSIVITQDCEILSDQELEQVKEVGRKYYEEHKAEIDGS